MGAGIDPNTLRKRLYNALKSQQRDLIRAGIPTVYRNLQLCPDTTGRTDGLAFNIRYHVLRASNGETAAMRYVTVLDGTGVNRYFGKDWDSEKGIELIKQLWKTS
jgi:hypothetical protein